MANASVNNMSLSALANSVQKGIGKSSVGVDDSFSQLFDQARQDIKGSSDNASPVARSKQVRVPQQAQNNNRPAETSASDSRSNQLSGSDSSSASSEESAALSSEQSAATTSETASDAGGDEPERVSAQRGEQSDAEAAEQQSTESEVTEKTEATVAAAQVAVTLPQPQPQLVIEEVEQVDSETVDTASDSQPDAVSTQVAAATATAAAAATTEESAEEPVETQPSLNASATARSVHEILARQKQHAELQAQKLAESWSALSADQQAQLMDDDDAMSPQLQALLHNGLSRGNMEALQRMFANKGEVADPAAEIDQSKINDEMQQIDDVLKANADADSQTLTALQHASSEKLRAVLELASQNMLDKRMNHEATLDQLSNQVSAADAAARPSPLLAPAPLSSLGSILRPGVAAAPGQVPGNSVFLENRMTDPTWGNEFAKRISFMVRGQMQNAEIRLNPPELGQIAVRINMVQDHANISFSAQHTNVREAIESALPRLRDLLNEGGLQMGSVDVSTQQQNQQQAGAGGGFNGHFGGGDGRLAGAILPGLGDEPMSSREQGVTLVSDRLVDYFA